MVQDPSQANPFRNLSGEILHRSIKKYYDFKFEDELMKKGMDRWHMMLSAVARSFKEEKESIVQRSNVLTKIQKALDDMVNENPLSLADKEIQGLMQKADKMRADSLKIYRAYDEIENMFKEQEAGAVLFGGGKRSLADKKGFKLLEEDARSEE